MSEKKEQEQINYSDYALDPTKDVLVPAPIFTAIDRLVNGVLKEHSDMKYDAVISYYNRKTHKKLSNKNRDKMDPERLNSEYYPNTDLEETKKTGITKMDDLGLFALSLLPEMFQIFKYNVDKGNKVLKAEPVVGPEIKPQQEDNETADES